MSITTFELFMNETYINRLSMNLRLQPQNYRDTSLTAVRITRRISARDSSEPVEDKSFSQSVVSSSAFARSSVQIEGLYSSAVKLSSAARLSVSTEVSEDLSIEFNAARVNTTLTPRNGPKPILAFGSIVKIPVSLTPRNELIPYQCTISIASCTKSPLSAESSVSISKLSFADAEIEIQSSEPSPPSLVFAMHQGLGSVLICWHHDESTASRYVVKVSESIDGPFTDFSGGSCYHKFCIAKNMPTGSPLYFAVAAVGTNGMFSDWVMAKSGKKQTIVTSLKVTAISGSVIESGFVAYSRSKSGRFASSAKATDRILVE